MSISSRHALSVTVLAVSVVLGGPAAFAQNQLPPGQGYKPTPSEIPLLPKFCWGQFTDMKGPEYEIRGCGSGMNHYCWGLVEQLRANRSYGNKRHRIGYLQKAKGNTRYTIKAMEKYPGCWLRPHVESTYQQVDAQLRAYGVK
jgi:hypothetical protein